MVTMGEINFKIAFLRTMAPIMSESDLKSFGNICNNLINGRIYEEDLTKLQELYAKFDKPAGRETI